MLPNFKAFPGGQCCIFIASEGSSGIPVSRASVSSMYGSEDGCAGSSMTGELVLDRRNVGVLGWELLSDRALEAGGN